MSIKLSPIADQLARQLKVKWNRHCDWVELRDVVDSMTDGEYPPMRLDRLTDMVKRRLPNR